MLKLNAPLHRRLSNSWHGRAALPLPGSTSPCRPRSAADAARTIRRLERHLGTMVLALGTAESQERDRIACRLHDELGQRIVLVRLKLGELRGTGSCGMDAVIDELTELVSQAAAAARAATFDLGQPAWCGGLFGALEALGSNLAQQAALEVRIDAPPPALGLEGRELGVVCRVVRELCLNVHKHARASRVHITSVIDGDRLRVSVQDDGTGLRHPIPPRWQADPAGGFGLASSQAQLRALGGELEMKSTRGRGTCASLLLPLPCPAINAPGRVS